MLQCKLTGKAALSVDGLDYEVEKGAILWAYELVSKHIDNGITE